jgi:hypothetical protein
MRARMIGFGEIEIEGDRFTKDIVIEGGAVRERDKTSSRPLKKAYGHTPLSIGEPIPWEGKRLIIGTGTIGRMPIAPEVREEADRRGVELVEAKTDDACRMLEELDPSEINAVIHITC